MSLLREIQEATVNPSFKVADVLRKSKILAARLGHQAFKEWIERELNGYKSIDELPEYRILRAIPSYGDFFGPFNSGVRNAPIPMFAIPEDFRDPISTVHLYQGVEALDSLLKSAEGIIIRMPWIADAVAYIQPRVYEHMHCATAWRMVPISAIAAITDTIKTRILDFALEIETQAPEAGEAKPGTQPVPEQIVSYIFNKCVLHGIATQNQGVVMSDDRSTTTNIQAGRDAIGNVGGDNSGSISNTLSQQTDADNEILQILKSLHQQIEAISPENQDVAVESLETLEAEVITPTKPAKIKSALFAL